MKNILTHVPVLLLFALLSIAMTWPLIFHMGDHVPSDPYDPLYNVWVMGWDLRGFSTGFKNFGDAPIFFPHHGTLYYADTLFALSLLGSPLVALTGNPIFAYNFLFILSFFLRGLGIYCLVLRLTRSRVAAAFSGLIFAFFPYNFAHFSHLELLYLAWIPFCFLFINKFFDNPSYGNLLGVGVFFVLQVLSCAYYGVYLALFAGLAFFYFAWKKKFLLKAHFWLKLGVLCAGCALILLPYFYPYFRVHERMLFERPLWEVEYFSAQVQHYLAVPPFHVLWGWLLGKLGSQEWQLFPGIIPMALTIFWWLKRPRSGAEKKTKGHAVFFWWNWLNMLFLAFLIIIGITGGFALRWGVLKLSVHRLGNLVVFLAVSLFLRVVLDRNLRNRWRESWRSLSLLQRWFVFMLCSSWLLSLGPAVKFMGRKISTGIYGLLYRGVPGFQGLRVPSRFAVMMMLALAVLAGWGMVLLLEKLKRPDLRNIFIWGAGALLLLEYLCVPLPLVPVPGASSLPRIYEAVKKLPPSAVLVELPMPGRDQDEHQEALRVYYTMYHRRRVVNGYSGYAPPAYRIVREAMDSFPTRKTYQLLQDLDVEYILVHTNSFRKDRGRKLAGLLKESPEKAELIAEADGDCLFRVTPEKKERKGEPRLAKVEGREEWSARANKNPHLVSLAFDGDPATGWSTGFPQEKGDFFLLDLGSAHVIKKIELLLNNRPLDFPRAFKTEGSLDGSSWELLDENPMYFPQITRSKVEDFMTYVVEVTFPPSTCRFLRITLTASHEARHWSIQEFWVRAPRGGSG